MEWLNTLRLQGFQCLYSLNRSANGVHTHLGVIDFSLLCCMIATPSPPLTGTTGNPLVKLVLMLTTHRVTTLETFSCWRGVVSSLSMYSMVYFLLSQQVLRRLPNIDLREELWNCCTSLSLFIQDNTRQPPPTPRLLPHLFLTTLQLFNLCVILSCWRVQMLKESGISPQ